MPKKPINSSEIGFYVDRIEHWSILPAKPVVSVLIVTYNHEKYIRECLDSALMQKTEFDFEIIIKEDKSTDRTRKVIEEYYGRHPGKFRLWLCKENLWNKIDIGPHVRAACRGKYIALCEGDDYWTDPLKLQKQVDFLESHPDFSYCAHAVNEVDDTGTFLRLRPRQPISPPGCEWTIHDLVWEVQVGTGSVLYRNSPQYVDLSHPVWTQAKAGDKVLLSMLVSSGRGWVFSDVMGSYRLHSDGVHSPLSREGKIAFDISTVSALISSNCGSPELLNEWRKGLDWRIFMLANECRTLSGFRQHFSDERWTALEPYMSHPRLLRHAVYDRLQHLEELRSYRCSRSVQFVRRLTRLVHRGLGHVFKKESHCH